MLYPSIDSIPPCFNQRGDVFCKRRHACLSNNDKINKSRSIVLFKISIEKIPVLLYNILYSEH